MTSPLRRKRPITARSTPAAKAEPAGAERRGALGRWARRVALGALLTSGGTLVPHCAVLAEDGVNLSGNPLRGSAMFEVPAPRPLATVSRPCPISKAPISKAANSKAPISQAPVANVQGPSNTTFGRLQWRTPQFGARSIDSQVSPAAAYTDSTQRVADNSGGPIIDPAPGNSVLTQVQQPRQNTEPSPSLLPAAPVPRGTDPIGPAAPPLGPDTPQQLPNEQGDAQHLSDAVIYDCKAGWDEMQKKKLSDISLDITMHATGEMEVPKDCHLGYEIFEPRNWETTNFCWTASGLCHKPPYFEEVQLERYGHETGPFTQPFVSGAHFFGNVLLLPYNMGLQGPQECVYALGYYRPGDCAPYMIPAFPITTRAVLSELGVAAGLVYLLP